MQVVETPVSKSSRLVKTFINDKKNYENIKKNEEK